MSNDYAAIPLCLRERAQWVVWKKEPKANGDGFTKVPYDAKRPAYKASTTKPETWSDFTSAAQAVLDGKANGIGYAFANGDGLTGIDLDHVINAEGELTAEASEIIGHFKGRAYVEYSPSGDGLHIWCYGKPIRTGKGTDSKWCEVYDAGSPRYLTVTGERYCDGDIKNNCQDALEWLYARHFAPKEVTRTAAPKTAYKFDGSEDERIREALRHISADDYENWITIGMALKAGSKPFDMWDWWSRTSAKYDPKGMENKWNSFHVTGLSLGTVFYLAQRGGWQQAPRSTGSKLSEIAVSEWLDPEPIDPGALPPVEPLMPELIPEPFRDYVMDAAERMSCPPDNIFAPLMVVAGAAIGTGCGIRPKAYDNWLVVPNIWGAVIAPPGRKKTAALKAATHFLDALEAAAEEKFIEAERQYKADYAEFKATEDRIKNDMKTAARPAKSRYAGKGNRSTEI